MTTSWYLDLDVCPHCGRCEESIHVGQSASGFHGYLEGDPRLPDWWGDRPILTPQHWREFVAQAIELGAVWRNDNGNAPEADPLTRIGRGGQQSHYLRQAQFDEVPNVVNVPTHNGAYNPHRMFWAADGYLFTTGEWS